MSDKQPEEIHPPDSGFATDLCLARLDSQRTLAAWIEGDGQTAGLRWSLRSEDGRGDVWSADASTGFPSLPRATADRIVWAEYHDGAGTLCELRLDTAGRALRVPQPIAALVEINAGECACSIAAGRAWMLVEKWHDTGTSLGLLRDDGRAWTDMGGLGEALGFRVRPRLQAGAKGLFAAWDEWRAGRYGVGAALIDPDGTVSLLPLPQREEWETLPAIAFADSGTPYLACCRERLIELDGGAANHHSELVVYRHAADRWLEAAVIDIDHGLNPWMAAYAGFRRFPVLVPDADGVWLLWEEKVDPDSMAPSLGRLCSVRVGPEGLRDEPAVLIADRCMFTVEHQAVAPTLRVASKTQWRAFDCHLSYELHDIHLERPQQPRPAFLASQRDRPTFRVRPITGPRPELPTRDVRLYFGDPHLHTRVSRDLDGEQDELYFLARETAKLDFVAFSENDGTRFTEPLTPADWQVNRRLAQVFNDPGRFTALLAWEYTLHTRPGHPESKDSHRTVLFPGSEGAVHSWVDGSTPTPADLVNRFKGERVLLHHHHPGGYDITDDELERNIEITSGWWYCMSMPDFVKNLHGLLNRGFRLGFIGGSDNHERNPGLGGALTGVWATENTREALFDAFSERRVFATNGLRPRLAFQVGDVFMGGSGRVRGRPVVKVTAECEFPVTALRVVRDGQTVLERRETVDVLDLTWRDDHCQPGRHWYYAHVTFGVPDPGVDWSKPMPLPWNLKPPLGPDAWTSPVWAEVEP